MVAAYGSIGHGQMPSGIYDPGTQSGGIQEHVEARRVVGFASAELTRIGVAHVAERCPDGSRPHAPNWSGSVIRANAAGVSVAVEVHFDWSQAPRGGFGIYGNTAGKRLADAIRARYKTAGLPLRSHQDRPGLGFIRNGTTPARILWECDRIDRYSSAHLQTIGLAMARGIADHLGVTIPPPKPDPPPPEPDPDPEVDVKLFRIDGGDTVYVTDGASRAPVGGPVEQGRGREAMKAMGWKMSQVEDVPSDHVLAQLPEVGGFVLLGRTVDDPTVWEWAGNPLRRRKIDGRNDRNRQLRDADFVRIPADHWLWRTPEV